MILRTDLSRLVNVAWLNAHFAAQRINDSGAIRSDKTRLGLAHQGVLHLGAARQTVNLGMFGASGAADAP